MLSRVKTRPAGARTWAPFSKHREARGISPVITISFSLTCSTIQLRLVEGGSVDKVIQRLVVHRRRIAGVHVRGGYSYVATGPDLA